MPLPMTTATMKATTTQAARQLRNPSWVLWIVGGLAAW
jgi:hypothetical protein